MKGMGEGAWGAERRVEKKIWGSELRSSQIC